MLGLCGSLHSNLNRPTTHKTKAIAVSSAARSKLAPHAKVKKTTEKNVSAKSSYTKDTIKKINGMRLSKVPFEALPGWESTDVKKSFQTFQTSCKVFLKQAPNARVGSQHITMRAKDWQPACTASLALDSSSKKSIKDFFEKWFRPIEFEQRKPMNGVFTGYYMPEVNGSLTKTTRYDTPIYGLPKKWEHNKHRSYSREQIDNGALINKAPVIAWISSPIDRLSFEIEGSGVVKLPDGKHLYLGYAGENGAHYTSIGSVLIKKGIFSKHSASKVAIKDYLQAHPKTMKNILKQNKSFVFFEDLKQPSAIGAKGMQLTPGYSLAVDKKWIPIGAPLWLSTSRPDQRTDNEVKFKRLMIAQDTGGAIRGVMRGDVYWGSGKTANFLGENMKTIGRYWLLLPKTSVQKMTA